MSLLRFGTKVYSQTFSIKLKLKSDQLAHVLFPLYYMDYVDDPCCVALAYSLMLLTVFSVVVLLARSLSIIKQVCMGLRVAGFIQPCNSLIQLCHDASNQTIKYLKSSVSDSDRRTETSGPTWLLCMWRPEKLSSAYSTADVTSMQRDAGTWVRNTSLLYSVPKLPTTLILSHKQSIIQIRCSI